MLKVLGGAVALVDRVFVATFGHESEAMTLEKSSTLGNVRTTADLLIAVRRTCARRPQC